MVRTRFLRSSRSGGRASSTGSFLESDEFSSKLLARRRSLEQVAEREEPTAAASPEDAAGAVSYLDLLDGRMRERVSARTQK